MNQTTANIEAKVEKIQSIVEKPSTLYQIPLYQRPYSWGPEEAGQMLEDIWQSSWINPVRINPVRIMKKVYFLGSFVLTTTHDQDSNLLDVLDGQQRLVTLTILFAIIRDFCEERSNLSDIDPETSEKYKSLSEKYKSLSESTPQRISTPREKQQESLCRRISCNIIFRRRSEVLSEQHSTRKGLQ